MGYPNWMAVIESFLQYIASRDGKELLKSTKIPSGYMKEFKEYAIKHARELCQTGEPEWQANPGGITANPDSAMPHLIFLPAIKEFHKDADPSSANSTAQKLLSLMFEQRLAQDGRVKKYQTAILELESIFDQTDLTSPLRGIQNTISDKLEKLIKLDVELSFSAPKLNDTLFQTTELLVSDRGLTTSLVHQGHGAQRALILTLLELYAQQLLEDTASAGKGCLVLCEEPEIYLHPQMCRRMRDVLVEIARTGTAQVICTTHSPVFLDLADRHDGIVILSRDEKQQKLTKQPQSVPTLDITQDDQSRLRMLLDFDPSVNELFFARRVVLVEGDSELSAYMAVLSSIARDSGRSPRDLWNQVREVAVVNCHGKDTIPPIQRVLNGFQIEYYVVHDLDSEGAKANQTIHSLVERDHGSRLLIHHPNFEREVFGININKHKPWAIYHRIMTCNKNRWPSKLLRFFRFVVGEALYDRFSLPDPSTLPLARPAEGKQLEFPPTAHRDS